MGSISLMVEDDDAAAGLIRLLLKTEGFAVLRAASADAAIQLAPADPQLSNAGSRCSDHIYHRRPQFGPQRDGR